MKVKAIIVDKIPKTCEDCLFKCMPVIGDGLFSKDKDSCLLTTEEDYLNK